MSDIFNDFAKIAIEQGLIDTTVVKTAEEETNPRHDSLTLDDIKALYGIKPEGASDKHIVEQAHPEPVIIAPSYDKLNGLVENVLERQNVMQWIATKPTDGKHTQERYVKASRDLSLALLDAAYTLDHKGETGLMKLADDCAEGIVKKALFWAIAIPAAIALLGLVNNFGGMLDAGVKQNCDRAVEELTDLLEPGEAPGQTELIQRLIEDINYVRQLNIDATSMSISTTGSQEEIQQQLQEGRDAMNKYIHGSRALAKEIGMVLSVFAKIQAQPEDYTTNWGALGGFLQSMVSFVWTPDIDEAIQILDTLRESLNESVVAIRNYYEALKTQAAQDPHQTIQQLVESGAPVAEEKSPEEKSPTESLIQQLPNVRMEEQPAAG